jgi:hypothetical protein
MGAGTDVVAIAWHPPANVGNSPGVVTIEHRMVRDVQAAMKQEEARRLADRLLGADKRERPLSGDGVHWVPGASLSETSDTP